MGAAGGSYDPPSFWFDVEKEIFKRTKAKFVNISSLPLNHETSPTYKPKTNDPSRLKGK